MEKLSLVKLEEWKKHEISIIETSDYFWYMQVT